MVRTALPLALLLGCSPARPVATHAAPAPKPSSATSIDAGAIDATPVIVDAASDTADAASDTADAADAMTPCPATFTSGGALCAPFGKKCAYPEGTCTCASASYCGGVAPQPEMLAALKVPRWICEPSPKVLGPDGCPMGIPSGLACKTPGKKCHYQPCCAFTVTCTNGKWVPGSPSCPP